MIHAVILAGGLGKRLWPKSRKSLPKHLLDTDIKGSSFQNLFNIITSLIPGKRIWVVTNKNYAKTLRKKVPDLPRKNLLTEPESKNTAAAIGLASIIIKKIDPQAVTVVLSSDHILGNKRKILQAIKAGLKLATENNALIAIGIRPYRPAREFGYLKIVQGSKSKVQSEKIYKVEKFVEKPSIKKAKAYLRSRNYLWNSGIFLWKVDDILKAIKRHMSKLYAGLGRIEKTWSHPQYKSRLAKEYKRFKNISIDYGVMERESNIYTVVGDFFWQDLGSWTNLPQEIFVRDKQGNIVRGLHKGIDTRGSIIFGENKHLISTLGVHNLIIVHTLEVTLICKKERAQEVKKLVEILEKDKKLKKYL